MIIILKKQKRGEKMTGIIISIWVINQFFNKHFLLLYFQQK